MGEDRDEPSVDAGEGPMHDAGSAEPVIAALPSEPAPYKATRREEPGPEAMPAAVIERDFQPITDLGPPTEAPVQYRPTGPDETGTDAGASR